jgi:hypothetical protein
MLHFPCGFLFLSCCTLDETAVVFYYCNADANRPIRAGTVVFKELMAIFKNGNAVHEWTKLSKNGYIFQEKDMSVP